jgi:hypothetical protein
MSQKIAIALIHGIGKANPVFADKTKDKFGGGMPLKLREKITEMLGRDVDSILVFEPVYWAPIIQNRQNELFSRLDIKHLDFPVVRDFVFHSLADSISYQKSETEINFYQAIHSEFTRTIKRLAEYAGEKSPLCIIAHSLGSVIASNYLWDLQNDCKRKQMNVGCSPLEQGETLTLFYTFGSQIAFWSLPHKNFGEPIKVPSPKLSKHYPDLKGEWINFYDKDDVLGYPIQNINEDYAKQVKDVEVNAGNALENWHPGSHNGYWEDDEVVLPIAKSLANLYRQINSHV